MLNTFYLAFLMWLLYKNVWWNNTSKETIHIQYAYCRNNMSSWVVCCVCVCYCSWVVGQHTLVVSTDQESRREILRERVQPGHVQVIWDRAFTGDGHAPETHTHTNWSAYWHTHTHTHDTDEDVTYTTTSLAALELSWRSSFRRTCRIVCRRQNTHGYSTQPRWQTRNIKCI